MDNRIDKAGREKSGPLPRFTCRQLQLIRQIAAYLDTYPEKALTLEKLSQEFSMPLTTMKRCFSAVYGMPVYAYLRRSRMKKAAKLLRETDSTILAVAGQVGYDNASKFAAAFKAVTGLSPSEYRRYPAEWETDGAQAAD